MKLKTILTAMILLTTHFGWAAVKDDESTDTLSIEVPKHQVKVGLSAEPIWLLVGGVGAKFEYFVTDHISVGINGVYIPEHQIETSSSKDQSLTSESYRWSMNEINLGSNIMLTGSLSTNGVYLNPAVGYQNTRISDYGVLKLKGSLSSPQARLTAGYQFVNPANNLRFALGAGLRMIQDSDILVKDDTGEEVYRQKTSGLGGLALDCHLGYIF
ncbi:MAG TPA: hypothetical protein VIG33_17995 [Pseudobdellovibrionaceae bacterium]